MDSSPKQSYNLNISQVQKLTLTPTIIQALEILQLNSQELEEYVKEQVLKNPMLEWNKSRPERDYSSGNEKASLEQYTFKEETFEDYILEQINISKMEEIEKKVAFYMLESLDENGYLAVSIGEISKALGIDIIIVEKVLSKVQEFEPVGVFARDLRECIKLQLEERNIFRGPIKDVIENHFDDLLNNRLRKISKETNLDVEKIQAIIDLVKQMNPKPSMGFASNEQTKYILPDLYLENDDKEYIISTNEDTIPNLKLNDYYLELRNDKNTDKEVGKYLNEKYNSAMWLIKSISHRKETIYKVAKSVISHQSEFFDKGTKYLKPMTLKEIAADIGVHESTISRAVNGKYIQTPMGIFEMKYFFSSGVEGVSGEKYSSNAVKMLIAEMIGNENPEKPVSDQKISEELLNQGINISRRTVAKYRESIGIMSSSKRRRF